jgi:DNA modification methylase
MEPITKYGDVYTLNNHRLACIDATDSELIKEFIGGASPSLVFTDPPFDMDFEHIQKVFNYFPDTFQIWVLDDRNAVRLAHDNINKLFTLMVYVAKNSLLTSNRQPIRVHCQMPVFNFKNANTDLVNYTTVFEFGRNLTFIGKTGLSHSKPVLLFQNTLKYFLSGEDIVVDFFSHSGSVLIAAESTGRISYNIEIDPLYCDAIVARYAEWMGSRGYGFCIKKNGVQLSTQDIELLSNSGALIIERKGTRKKKTAKYTPKARVIKSIETSPDLFSKAS